MQWPRTDDLQRKPFVFYKTCAISFTEILGEMTSVNASFQPFKLDGTGNFSDVAHYSHLMFETFAPVILEALENVFPSPGQPFVIADYGTADGGASYDIIRQCVAQLRRRYGPEIQIQVIYEDQPVNDFRPVFQRAEGLLSGSDGLFSEFTNVYVTASGTSFYRQCLPDNSIDFIISSISLHWLSQCPVEMPRDLFPNLTSPSLRSRFREQAKLDLKNFILHRESELKPGGRMALINVEPQLDKVLLQSITDSWRSLVSKGTITETEFCNTNFAMYFRPMEDWAEVLGGEGSDSGRTGLRRIGFLSRQVPLFFVYSKETDSLENIGRSVVSAIRTWTDCTLYNGLGDDRSHAQKVDILDMFCDTFLHQIIAKGDILNYTLPVFCMVLENSTGKNA